MSASSLPFPDGTSPLMQFSSGVHLVTVFAQTDDRFAVRRAYDGRAFLFTAAEMVERKAVAYTPPPPKPTLSTRFFAWAFNRGGSK